MCGVAGIVSHDARVSYVIYFLLFALQHRGQEAAGIGTEQNGEVFLSKDMGTIDWVFRKRIPAEEMVDFVRERSDMPRDVLVEEMHAFEQDPENEKAALAELPGNAAIGHVRYSTTGASGNKNNHPLLFHFQDKPALIAHNGNLVRLKNLREIIEARGGYDLEGTTDTELIAALMATSLQPTFYDALLETLPLLDGAFSLVLLYEGTVYAAKDKFGIRPLCVGKSANAYMVVSETCALDIGEAEFMKELDPGEGAILHADGIEYFQWCQDSQWRACLFDAGVYFSRPDSNFRGRGVHEIRKTAGVLLARRAPVLHADKVFAVPDSGGSGAQGYGEELSIQVGKFLYALGIVRSHFVGRTFIEAVLELRHEYRRIKYNPIRSEVEGKVVVIVDDSLIRGTTMPYIVALLKLLGAKEVHVRIVAPPSKYGCHLGVDLPYDWELVANNRTEEEVRVEINRLAREMSREADGTEVGEALDSLAYLPLPDLLEATGLPPDSFCTGCFDKNWPVPREEGAYEPKAV